MAALLPIIFIQIPKTAGNSFQSYLRGLHLHLGLSKLNFAAASSVMANSEVPDRLMAQQGMSADQFDIVAGHMPFGTAQKCFVNGNYITILRNPVDRMLSDYCSQPANVEKPKFGLDQLADILAVRPSPEFAFDNMQVRMLCDNPRFGEEVHSPMLDEAIANLSHRFLCFGVLEKIDDFLRHFAILAHVPTVDIPTLHASGYFHGNTPAF